MALELTIKYASNLLNQRKYNESRWARPSLWYCRETTAFFGRDRAQAAELVLSNRILCLLQESCLSHSHVFLAGPVNRVVDGRIIF